ncbi:MAG: CDC48 family AAA ATPase [Candidatus Marsarchaeota archaeon]|nr:CDC48 family AAA ATPase [Candidatus Marsarchaeota archaeon]
MSASDKSVSPLPPDDGSVVLRVAEAKQRDVGRNKVRVDSDIMAKINVGIGDVVEIYGKRKTVAIVWPAYVEDKGTDTIRMDGLIRKNCGVSIGDKVVVKKIIPKAASSVKLAPSSYSITVDPPFISYVKKKLVDYPLVEGDTVLIPVLGQAISFTVVAVKATDAVMVTENTQITILDKPTESSGVPRVTYEDIGGMKDVIPKVREMIELPLRHPELFKRLGIEPPKGVLLYGPPGSGKTLLAKAVANETDAYFVAINGPEIMSKFYGESEQKLREVFEDAKKHAPAIIFIDELDAIAPKREEVTGEVEHRVVAQLLTLMDGLEARGDVIVIGATNRANALDPALRRPGRFDREIEIVLPEKQGRMEILQIHTRNMPLEKDTDLKKLADMTHGYTGADLAALAREAAMKALRRYLPDINVEQESIPPEILEKMTVKMEDFLSAYKEVVPTALREVYIETPEVHWDQIGGLEDIRSLLTESVEWPLRNPEVFEKFGIRPTKGILLYGPPGCGKTLIAKAVATESEANFIPIKGPEVFSKWLGESEKAIREAFRRARQSAPCILFLDELDAMAPARGGGYDDTGATERVVTQLLTELDGMEKLENVVVIGATNRPDILDAALLRPGRLDRLVYVSPPDEKSRLEILKIYTKKMQGVDLERLVEATDGYSGADLEMLCREAALSALRENISSTEVKWEHFEQAMKIVRPSITEEMLRYYKMWGERARQLKGKEQPLMNYA